MDLRRDTFAVTFNPTRVDLREIMERIQGLGYRPEEASVSATIPGVAGVLDGRIPPPVGAVLDRAQAVDRLLLIEFYAAWCGPCRFLERSVLTDARVRDALEQFEFLKVDTDEYVGPSNYYRITALPTLLVVNPDGVEVCRHEGMIGPEELARRLEELVASRRN